jgi:ATP-dependent RNA helicase RhlE
VVLPGFDYTHKPAERFEIPIGERIAQIRARKAEDRQRAKANAERRAHYGAPANRAPSHHATRKPERPAEREQVPEKAPPPRGPLGGRMHRRGR